MAQLRSEITLYNANGGILLTALIEEASKMTANLMQDDYVELVFSLPNAVRIPIGAYCFVPSTMKGTLSKKYIALAKSFPTYNESTGCYDYNVHLDAWYYNWKRYAFSLNPKFGPTQLDFSYTQKPIEHIKLLYNQLTSLNEEDTSIDVPVLFALHYNGRIEYWGNGGELKIETDEGTFEGKVLIDGEESEREANLIIEGVCGDFKLIQTVETEEVPETSNDSTYLLTEDVFTATYSSVNIIDAINTMCGEDALNCEWWIDNSNVMHFGRCEDGELLDIKHSEDYDNMTRSQSSDEYGTRLVAFGSTMNVPARYRKSLIMEATNVEDYGGEKEPVSEPVEFFTKKVSGYKSITVDEELTRFIPTLEKAKISFHLRYNFTATSTDEWRVTPHFYLMLNEESIGYVEGFLATSAEVEIDLAIDHEVDLVPNIENVLKVRIETRCERYDDFTLGYAFYSRTKYTIKEYSDNTYKRVYDSNRKISADMFDESVRVYESSVQIPLTSYSGNTASNWPYTDVKIGEVSFEAKNVYARITGSSHMTFSSNISKVDIIFWYGNAEQYLSIYYPIYTSINNSGKQWSFDWNGWEGNIRTEKPFNIIRIYVRVYNDVYYAPATIKNDELKLFVSDNEKTFKVETKCIINGIEHQCTINPFKEPMNRESSGYVYLDSSTNVPLHASYQLVGIVKEKVPVPFFTDDYEEDTNISSYERRLMLPVDKCPHNYIEAEGSTVFDRVTVVKKFDDIYPSIEIKIAKVEPYKVTIQKEDDDGKPYNVEVTRYKFYLRKSELSFKQAYITGNSDTLQCTFQDGKLAGLTFNLMFDGDALITDEEGFNLQVYRIDNNDEKGIDLPNEILCPSKGDTIVFLNYCPIYMEDMNLVRKAEERLYNKAKAYLDKISIESATYQLTLYSDVAKALFDSGFGLLEIGQKVKLIDETYFDTYRETRVIGISRNIDIPFDSPTLTLGESLRFSRMREIENKLNKK